MPSRRAETATKSRARWPLAIAALLIGVAGGWFAHGHIAEVRSIVDPLAWSVAG